MSKPTPYAKDAWAAEHAPEYESAQDGNHEPEAGSMPARDVEPTEELPAVESAESLNGSSGQAIDDSTQWVRPLGDVGPTGRRGGLLSATNGIWIGCVLAGAGFGGIYVGWSKVAGLKNVAEQVPFLISGGLVGLALIIIGVAVLDVSVRRKDSYDRQSQLAEVARTLASLRVMIEAADERAEKADHDH